MLFSGRSIEEISDVSLSRFYNLITFNKVEDCYDGKNSAIGAEDYEHRKRLEYTACPGANN